MNAHEQDGVALRQIYDAGIATLKIVLKPHLPVSQRDEDKPGVILDYGADGNSSCWKP